MSLTALTGGFLFGNIYMTNPEKQPEITPEMVEAGVELLYFQYDEGALNADEAVMALFRIFASGGLSGLGPFPVVREESRPSS